MKIILNANETVLKILKRFKKTDTCTRMIKYCVKTHTDDGVLLFNLLTRELVLLTDDEYAHFTELEYLRDRWFVVPEEANEKEYMSFIRWFLGTHRKNLDTITGYTIFPTTDCNARCFYCFEHKFSKITMSRETAVKIVQYIKKHSGGKRVWLYWFGGEPLFNREVMDIICTGLREEGIEYSSSATTNGYLFDDEVVQKAVNLWNLKAVQITLDGTEEVYNRIKAYIDSEGSPYQKVLRNIELLADASVKTTIRLNIDLHNADDLMSLANELSERFNGKKNIKAYLYPLFRNNEPMAELHSEDEWNLREAAIERIEEKLMERDLLHTPKLARVIRESHCMADRGDAVSIFPDGNIGLCDQYSDPEYIGHIDSEGFDFGIVESWRETVPEVPECADCFYYPDCIKIKKCGISSVCFPFFRRLRLKEIKRAMAIEYEKWKADDLTENDDVEINLH
ncbi:MAG: radical SAM protein [Clostridia bacterium]|nr:radical SAM protein [Clostridia bacterium]